MKQESKDEEDEFEKIPSEEEDNDEDTASYDIIPYGADYTLSVFYDKMKKGEIEVPDFQRKYVWSIKQASKLVESFLLGLPVPGIFLAKEKQSGNLIVIDGQQRLVTCKSFRDERFPISNTEFRLVGVHEKWEGIKYSELVPADRKRFDDSVLRATIIQQVKPENDDTSTYQIFKRLNTGGTILQNQEIRNCLYYGTFNELLHKLNKNKTWRVLYNSEIPNKRMRDEELILRFFALYYKFNAYTKPMSEFLNKFMSEKRNIPSQEIKKMEEVFKETISFINEKAGSFALRPRGNVNSAAFDSITYVVAKYKKNLKDNFSENIKDLFKDNGYFKAIREGTTDPETIKSRISIAKRYLVR